MAFNSYRISADEIKRMYKQRLTMYGIVAALSLIIMIVIYEKILG